MAKTKLLYHQESEQSVVGSLLIDSAQLPGVAAIIGPEGEAFHSEQLREVFLAIKAVFLRQEQADNISVSRELARRGKLTFVGGDSELTRLIGVPQQHLHVLDYAYNVANDFERRKVMAAAQRIVQHAHDAKCQSPLEAARAELQKIQPAKRFDTHKLPATWADLAAIIPDVEWIWHPWLPKGLLTLLVGRAGSGKSALALAVAQSVIQGKPWPDGTSGPGGGKVVWAETEAAQAVNLDRAKKWDVPLAHVITPDLGDPLADLKLDEVEGWGALERAANRPEVKLVIADSLRGAFRGDENASDCVELLTRLATLARDVQLPVLVVHHLRKKSMFDDEKIQLDRVRGSSVITQLARVVWAIDRPDPYLPDHVRLFMIKNNVARFPEPVGFEISAQGVIFGEAPEEPQQESQRDKAADLLLTLLREEPVLASEVYAEGEGAAISKITLKRAKKALGIVAIRKEGRWYWSLPAH